MLFLERFQFFYVFYLIILQTDWKWHIKKKNLFFTNWQKDSCLQTASSSYWVKTVEFCERAVFFQIPRRFFKFHELILPTDLLQITFEKNLKLFQKCFIHSNMIPGFQRRQLILFEKFRKDIIFPRIFLLKVISRMKFFTWHLRNFTLNEVFIAALNSTKWE